MSSVLFPCKILHFFHCQHPIGRKRYTESKTQNTANNYRFFHAITFLIITMEHSALFSYFYTHFPSKVHFTYEPRRLLEAEWDSYNLSCKLFKVLVASTLQGKRPSNMAETDVHIKSQYEIGVTTNEAPLH